MSCYCLLLPIFKWINIPLKLCVEQLGQIIRGIISIKWTQQSERFEETFIPVLKKERVVKGSSAVMVVHCLSQRRQGISSFCRFAVHFMHWVLPVYTTKMGDPCMDQEIVLVIESPFTRRPPGLSPFLLTGLHRNTCCSARLLYVRNEAVVFVIAVRVLPPATYKPIKRTYYYTFLHIFTCQECFGQA